MIELKRIKKSRSENALFNPHKNGITSYDMAYLSTKNISKNKSINLKRDAKNESLAA